MKLGAQFFTLRERNKTPEGLYESFKRVKEIGYQVVQMSAICQIEAERLKSFSEEFDLPITCTHSAFDRIVNDTDALIKEHITYGCPVIGIGSMPNEYRGSIEGARAFMDIIREPIKKIEAAGLRFAYHNHDFEFVDLGGVCSYDLLMEELPSLNFILDTYWFKYAERSYLDYIKLMGNERLTNVHFKDMKTEPKGEICPCGVGTIDFAPVVKLCDNLKIPYALVEQDNAPKLGDEFEQLTTSFNNLKHLF
ncbi:MAG: sugar phosphate isomerase/epimerase [Ruminococcaceae bacterium]|nr:sugar phosphate isomerase/epimerase [Oscillospiraceae bacterium]